MTATTFPLTKVQRLCKEAATLAQPSDDGPERWSKSVVDPMNVLAVFTNYLRIKEGYVLRAYLFREDGVGQGVVWAMTADADYPEPYDRRRVRHWLTQLMIDHDIGVATARTYMAKEMDVNHFEEEEG